MSDLQIKKERKIGIGQFTLLPRRYAYRNTNMATGIESYRWLWFYYEIKTRYY